MTGLLKNEKGIALFLVLWILMLLLVIVGEFSFTVRSRLNIIKNFKDNTQAYYYALAGVNNAIASLIDSERDPSSHNNPDFQRNLKLEIEGDGAKGGSTATIGNESGKVNINTADKNLLMVMLNGMSIEKGHKDIIADSILDWRDKDNLHRMNGAEDDYYLDLENPYECRDDKFQSIEELLLVRGVSADIFAGLKDIITIYPTSFHGKSSVFIRRLGGSNSNKININFASKRLLGALPMMTDEWVDQVIEYRDDHILQNINELQAVVDLDVFKTISPYLTTANSSFFSVDSMGYIDGSRSKSLIHALIEINNKSENGYRFVDWKEE